jgi:hypothetical protein
MAFRDFPSTAREISGPSCACALALMGDAVFENEADNTNYK